MKIWQKLAITSLVAGSLVMGSLPTLAGTDSPKIDTREVRQQQRIYNGANSGTLTQREFNRLENQQARIQAAEAQMKSDGRLTKGERYRLHQMLNRSSATIHRAKANGRVR